MVDAVIELSSVYFKSLNGCDGLEYPLMMTLIAETVKYAFAPRCAKLPLPGYVQFGMGRDTARAIPLSKVSPEVHVEVERFTLKAKRSTESEEDRDLEYALVIEKGKNRFQVSDHQWSLIALGYGRGEPDPHWDDFELAAALHLRLTMMGLQGHYTAQGTLKTENVWNALQTLSCRDGETFVCPSSVTTVQFSGKHPGATTHLDPVPAARIRMGCSSFSSLWM
jgi:hypothetical protein